MLKYRQGDVGLEPISNTDGLEFKPVKQAVLAEGEKTGHFHVLTATAVMEAEKDSGKFPLEMAEKDGVMYLRVAEPLPLKHAEHATITIAPGTYKVARQCEYTPEAPRQVLD
jgi:hypothetical protein